MQTNKKLIITILIIILTLLLLSINPEQLIDNTDIIIQENTDIITVKKEEIQIWEQDKEEPVKDTNIIEAVRFLYEL